MMNRIPIALCALACSSFAVTGVAVDHQSHALAGVQVQFALDGNSTTTGADGSFSLEPKTMGILSSSAISAFHVRVENGTLHYVLPQAVEGFLRTYDLQGHLVHAQTRQVLSAGDHQFAPFGSASQQAPGLYLVQYQFGLVKGTVVLASGEAQGGAIAVSANRNALRLQTVATVDTLRFSLSGFVTKSLPITDYAASLGNVQMDSASQGTSSSSTTSSSSISSSAVGSSSSEGCTNTYGTNVMTDCRDGQTYATVNIAYQTWMNQNLNYKPTAGTSWCYNNDDGYCSLYGRLYNWTTAMDTSATYANVALGNSVMHQGACPYGWHVPSYWEWRKRLVRATVEGVASGYWTGSFRGMDTSGYWWASTQGSGTTAYSALDSSSSLTAQNKGYGYSLRCVKDYSVLVDARDGQQYRTVQIGTQTWMAENLNYSTTVGSWCFDNTESNCTKYGRLYRWSTASDAICPSGWDLPSQSDWKTLIDYAGGGSEAGTALKSTEWTSTTSGVSSLDSYGFSALPGGAYDGSRDFFNLGGYSSWWTSTSYSSTEAYNVSMLSGDNWVHESYNLVDVGLYVRCIQK
jgi:uncharacterized protein (TIGR02145 family)